MENLTKSFGDLVLFENISLGLSEGQRVGLIAKNGSGKTTLLNILSGKEGYDNGTISFRRDLRVGYLEQDPQYPEELTVLEACFHHGNSTVELIKEYERCMETEGHPGLDEILVRMDHEKAWEYEQKAKQILSQLKIRDFSQHVKYLSGGQLKRVALANTLITEPDLLILDEPTNHLDLDMTEWLEEYLRRNNLSLLMVTHDRYFLDRVCSEIVEIDNRQIYQYKGNYSYYLEKRQERIEAKTVEIERANNLYRTELEWMRRMPQARGHKARYREDAFYELEKVAKQRFNNDNVKLDVKASYIGSKIFESDHPEMAKNPMMGCTAFGMPLFSLVIAFQFPAGAGIYWIMSNIIAFAQMILLNYTHSPKKIIAKMMVEETVNRRSKEENMKRIAQREMEA